MDNYISLKEVLDNITDHPLLKDVTFERAVQYTVRFMRIVGMPDIFIEKTQVININDWRGQLPCDYYDMIQVRTHKNCGHPSRVFRYSTDSFHMSENKQHSYDLTYKLQNSFIFTSMKEGEIEIAYRAILIDDDGYPMIPDNSSFIRALELFIKKTRFGILFDTGKINIQVFNQACQDYAWAVGQAQSELIRPSIDKMESFTNMLNTIVSRVSEHKYGFKDSGTKEHIKLQ